MTYTEFKAGGKEYKLRLNTRAIVKLEKDLGVNPIYVFLNPANKNVPTIEQMVIILKAALTQYHPDVTLDGAYDIFDEYLADGNLVGEFVNVIVEVYKQCGLFKNVEDNEKN